MIFVGKWSHGITFFSPHAFGSALLCAHLFASLFFYIYKKPIIRHKGLMYVCMAF